MILEPTSLSKPRLCKYLHVLPTDKGKVIFHAPGKTVMLEGTGANTLIPALLEHLDGSRTVAEILTELGQWDERSVISALTRLYNKGLLEDADIQPPPALSQEVLEHCAGQITFFSHFLHDPYSGQSALQGSQVGLIGAGSVGWHAATALAIAGVGHMRIVDKWTLLPEDQRMAYGQTADDIGRPRSTVLADHLRRSYPQMTVENNVNLPDGEKEARGLIHGCNLILVCQEQLNVTLLRWINQACNELGTPWIHCHLDGSEAVIGPLVVPGETACYECYRLRCKSSQKIEDERLTLERYLENLHDERPRYGQLNMLASIAAGSVALEAIKQLNHFALPVTYNHVYKVDFLTLEGDLLPVLKLPRCPVCSRQREYPLTYMWVED